MTCSITDCGVFGSRTVEEPSRFLPAWGLLHDSVCGKVFVRMIYEGRIKAIITVLLPVVLFLCSHASAERKRTYGDAVAEVNGTLITSSELDKEMAPVKKKLLTMGYPLNQTQMFEIKREILENLINRELLYQASVKNGIKVESEAVDEEFAALKKRFQSDAAFKTALKRMGTSEKKIKSEIRRRMAIQRFGDRKFARNVTISEAEARAHYDSHPEFFRNSERVRVSHIFIKVDAEAEKAKREEALQKLENIKRRLKNGEKFATLARIYSQCPSGVRGGDLGNLERGTKEKVFEDVAFSLKPGEVSEIVKTKTGYHLIKVFDKRPATVTGYEEIKEKLKHYLKQEKIRKRAEAYLEKMKKTAKIKIFPLKALK